MRVRVTITKEFEAYEDERIALRGTNPEERQRYFMDSINADPGGFFDGAIWKVSFPRKAKESA